MLSREKEWCTLFGPCAHAMLSLKVLGFVFVFLSAVVSCSGWCSDLWLVLRWRACAQTLGSDFPLRSLLLSGGREWKPIFLLKSGFKFCPPARTWLWLSVCVWRWGEIRVDILPRIRISLEYLCARDGFGSHFYTSVEGDGFGSHLNIPVEGYWIS